MRSVVALRLADSTARTAPITVAEIYESQLEYVFHSLRRLGVPDRDREDVAHDVFMVVHRRLGSYDPACALRAWLFGIAYRIVADYRRRAHVRREVLTDETVERGEAPPAHADRELVLRALETIELDRRAVFILHDLDGQSIPEIARVIDAPENTLYSHLSRARQQFAAAVTKLRGDA